MLPSIWCLLLSALGLVHLTAWHWWDSVLCCAGRPSHGGHETPLLCLTRSTNPSRLSADGGYRFRQPSVILLLFVGSWQRLCLAKAWCSCRAPTTLGRLRIHRPIKEAQTRWAGAEPGPHHPGSSHSANGFHTWLDRLRIAPPRLLQHAGGAELFDRPANPI